MAKRIINSSIFGGGYSTTRKEASVRFVSDDRIEERRSEVRLNDKEVAKWLLP